MDQPERIVAHFVYRSIPSPAHHGVSVMLVARLSGSNVVARVDPLGRGAPQGTLRRGMHLLGPWMTTASRRYAKARVALARS